MPSLNDSRKVITTHLPGIEGSQVSLYDSLTVGDAEKISNANEGAAKGLEALYSLMISWNLDEELNPENFRKLNSKQFQHLMQQTALLEDGDEDEMVEKKTA